MVGKVLIVDDLATNRVVLKVKLSQACYQTLQAEDGETALRIARTQTPALILLDLKLPDMDGLDVCRRLRADPATSRIPIIIVTAIQDAAGRVAALRAGADDFLSKPVDEIMLLARIRSLMRARETERELQLREQDADPQGFAEATESFEPPARIALVTARREDALRWRHVLAPHMRDRLEPCTREEVLGAAQDSPAPEMFVIAADLGQPTHGLQLMSELRARATTRHAAICIVIDGAARDIGVMALDLGASDLIDAAFDAQETALRLTTQLRRKRQADRLRAALHDEVRLAMTDPLTGLHNRRHAVPQLNRLIDRAHRAGTSFAVMVLDIDRFKEINDRWSHATGDAVLTQVAHRLRDTLRPSDLLARIGGEEFLVAIPDVTLGSARLAAERLRRVVEERPVAFPDDSVAVQITISIGLTFEDGQGFGSRDGPGAMQAADAALLQAKAAGRNRVTDSCGTAA